MGYFWATWLADALRKDPFVAKRMIEVPGWQTRGRPPSQFSFLPSGVLDHHTACMIRTGHDPQTCLNFNLAGKPEAPGPISQLLGTWTPPGVKFNGSNVDPRIMVVAAGRSNHAGVGEYLWGAPPGNGSSIGIEWCGPSEALAWPDVVIELRERVVAAILKHNGWTPYQATTHWEYARPLGRKIDPSGPYIAEPKLAWNAHWDPNVWRGRIAARMKDPEPPVVIPPIIPPLPPTITVEDNMEILTTPSRVYDSRKDKVLAAGQNRVIPLGLPATTKGAVVNLTVTAPKAAGHLKAWASGATPAASVVNYAAGQTIANQVVVPVANGSITVVSHAEAHLVVDLAGFYP